VWPRRQVVCAATLLTCLARPNPLSPVAWVRLVTSLGAHPAWSATLPPPSGPSIDHSLPTAASNRGHRLLANPRLRSPSPSHALGRINSSLFPMPVCGQCRIRFLAFSWWRFQQRATIEEADHRAAADRQAAADQRAGTTHRWNSGCPALLEPYYRRLRRLGHHRSAPQPGNSRNAPMILLL